MDVLLVQLAFNGCVAWRPGGGRPCACWMPALVCELCQCQRFSAVPWPPYVQVCALLHSGRRVSGMCSQVRLPLVLAILSHVITSLLAGRPCQYACQHHWERAWLPFSCHNQPACLPTMSAPTTKLLPSLAAPQSPSFPVLRKPQEVATMDYKAAARERRLWSMFERWITAKNGSGSRPLAIEMGSRAG